ncbi:hypothetical protein VNO77_32751 [Canavalia gladiata]|uniref:Myb/SANT-like domain-containing protein n=1 Tax=Canavalia gladiata TaxID=3824 RepID=A0AAN9Q2C7_CANGL
MCFFFMCVLELGKRIQDFNSQLSRLQNFGAVVGAGIHGALILYKRAVGLGLCHVHTAICLVRIRSQLKPSGMFSDIRVSDSPVCHGDSCMDLGSLIPRQRSQRPLNPPLGFRVARMDLEPINQPKQERSRTRWTASLDKIFADLVVKQIQLGNRPNNVFDKKTWNHIRDEFNRQTDLNFNNNQLRKHLDVLRTRFYNLKSAYDQNNDFVMDDSCCIGFEQWEDIGAQPRHETVKVKDCPIYEQLCTIFIDSAADGKYAQSSHYEELDKSIGIEAAGFTSCPEAKVSHYENPSTSKSIPGNMSTAEKVTKHSLDRKRKRPYETQTTSLDQDTCNAMAEALLDMVAVSRLRAVVSNVRDDKFSITNCIRALDEIEGIDQQLYFSALDLFEDPSLRETFISLKSVKIRLTWLQGKCSKSPFR